ncbi:MAG: ADP-ribosylglycohydrolase family protein [Desulfobacterales bacterium]|nr:ADP-ribosylglycohydrolase family protein [Desulfobacterales bacterium]
MDNEKAKGLIFGLAIGDALGYPTEFITLARIKTEFGPNGIADFSKSPALFTDDTQMSIAIAEALIKAGAQDLETIMEAIKEEFIKWRRSPENNRAPGNACLAGVSNMERGVHWSESGVADSKGCGSAMRVAPIGYVYQHDPDKLKLVVRASGICTHGHRTAIAASIGAAYLVKLALDGTDPGRMIPETLSFTAGISREFDTALSKVSECLNWPNEEDALKYLGEGWIGEEAVALALYCFLRHPDDYKVAVLRGANTNGDSDSIACIAGSISGAYNGIDAIPNEWIKRIEKSEFLNDLATRLAEKKASL